MEATPSESTAPMFFVLQVSKEHPHIRQLSTILHPVTVVDTVSHLTTHRAALLKSKALLLFLAKKNHAPSTSWRAITQTSQQTEQDAAPSGTAAIASARC